MIHSDNMLGNGALSLGNLDFNTALEATGRPEPDRSFLNAAIAAADINNDVPLQQEPVVNPMQRLTDVCLYNEDEEAAERVEGDVLVSETARGDVFGQNMLIGVELADMMTGGDVYETAERFIGALPREQQQAWRDKLNHCHTKSDGQALVGELFRNGVVEQYRTNKAKQESLEEERGLAFNGVFSELVKDANNEEAWNRFREGQARGAFTDADKKALDSAAKAWGMMEILMSDYTRSGAAVLTDAESGERIFNELYGDEMAQAVFLNVLQNEVQDLKNDASRRNALERFGRAFAATTNNLMAGVIGGKFKAFVTDEQVDAYNREWERARELSGRENPNVAVYAEGDNWVEKYLLPGNARIDAIRKAAQESGQMNQDGSLRKMTAEERKGTQELGAFRGVLNNAVQGMYDVPGVAAKLGKMMPDSLIYLVPGGMLASAGSMHTHELARQLGEGADYVSANTKAAVEAGISAAVEKLAFGSLKPARMAPGLDWLMSRKVVGQALGKIYGSTAGRIGLGVVAGTAEETFAEPLAGLIMRGVYNVAAADELQLADPLGAYRKEMEEMLAPDQILVTGLYGLLLGGVSAGGHMQAAKDYREMYKHLVNIGVDEGRAAQAARDDEAVASFKATKALFEEAVKKDSKGVIAYLAELYPQLETVNVAENLFSTWNLPHLIPAENGQVMVQEKDEDGNVTETMMSKEAADLLVQARLEQMKSSEIANFANQLLGVAMAGKASSETDRFIVEEVDGAMDADYFTRLANAAGVRLQQGARADEVAPEIHQHMTLGQLVQQGKAWEQRMEIQRNEVDRERAEKNLPPLTDEEWAERKKDYVAAVNRQSVRGADGRKRTLLRVSRGHYGAMNVLEDLTEDFIARDMAANNRGLEWYVQNIRELEKALGRQNEFLRELGEGKKPVNQMDIIEAVGKIAQSKLLADTVKGEHGFSAALKSFLEMIRTLILKAAAMLKLGKAINQALTDETVRGKMDTEFLQLVDDVVAQDIEFLRELQLEDGLKAMQRVIAARQEANADTRVKRLRKANTPVLDKAEKNHGKQVREAARKKRRKQAKVDADVEVAEEALEEDFSSSVEAADVFTSFSVRLKPEPKKTGVGYKVFYQKDGKLYPPMVANPGGADTPVGVWLDADEGVRAGTSKTGRPQVKAGGKGTQGGSGTLAYRPGWHLGEIPYAIQFNRKNPLTGERDLFPKDFVWAEVEYAADEDYQAEVDASDKRHSYRGLQRVPEDGFYRYRTNPDPKTDPWIITGAMKVNKVLSKAEVDELVRDAGREPQKVEGDETDTSMSVTDAQERGLFEDGVLEASNAVVTEPSFSIEALHATPHRFRKFDTSKMGSGEGNQAFGWGLYFSGDKGSNREYYRYFADEYYQMRLFRGDNELGEKELQKLVREVFLRHGGQELVDEMEEAIVYSILREGAQKQLDDYEAFLKDGGEDIPGLTGALQELAGMEIERKSVNLPAINYRVELNADDSNLLMWDKKVPAELHDAVRELKSGQPARGLVMQMPEASKEAWEGYRIYSELTSALGTPKAASEWLAERGYKGIKYLDGMSRRAGEGTYNYVIFSGDDVKITGVNETGDYNAPWEDYEDTDASFNVVGESAENWDEIKDRAFRGRDDGKLRVELDASQAKIKGFPKVYPVYDVMRKLVDDGVYDSVEYKVYSSLKFIEEMTETEKGERKLNETELKEDADRFPDLADEMSIGLNAAGLTWESDIQSVRGACFTALSKWKKKLEEELTRMGIEKPVGEAWHALVEQKPGLGSANVGKRVVSAWSGKWLDDVLDFPELYKAYPQLRSIQLAEDTGMELADASYADFARRHEAKAGKEDGQYPFGFINMNPKSSAWSNDQEAKGLLLHEVQHAIQSIEGFAKGGNPKTVREAVEKLLENDGFRIEWLERDLRWFSAVDIARDFLKEARMLRRYPNAWKRSGQRFRFARMSSTADEVREAILRDIAERYEAFRRDDTAETLLLDMNDSLLPVVRFSSLESIEAGLEKLKMLKSRKQAFRGTSAKKGRKLADLQKRYDRMKRVLDKFKYEPFELYRRMAGEIESRNVELRRDWTAAERAARPFNETLEYPDEALVSFSTVHAHLYQEVLDSFEQRIAQDGSAAWVTRKEKSGLMVICPYPEVLNQIVPWWGNVVAKRDVIQKLMNKHGLLPQDVAKLPHALWDPVAVFEDPDSDKGFIVITDILAPNFSPKRKTKKKNKEQQVRQMKQVMAVLELRADGNNAIITDIVSAYSADATDKYKALLKDGYLRYADAERALMWATAEGDSVLQLRTTAMLHPGSGVILKADLQNVNTDFSSSLVNLDEEVVAAEVVAAGQGFKANLAYSEAIMKEMRSAMQRLRRVGGKTRTDREDAVAAMGTMVQMVKAAAAYLPKGYRFAVHPYLKRLEVLAEMATTGDIDLTKDMASKALKKWLKEQQDEQALLEISAARQGVTLESTVEEIVKDHGEQQLLEAVEGIMNRVATQLRKHAKDRAVAKITELVERLRPKKDAKSGKLKGGKMSAESYRDLEDVFVAMNMNPEDLEAKLAGLRAQLEKPGISEEERAQIESEMAVYDQFGDLKGMSAEEAVEAYEALRHRVWMHRFEWDNIMAERRHRQRAMVRSVVDGVGSVSENEYNAKKRLQKPGKRLKHVGDILSGMPAALTGLRGYLPLRGMADDLARRANAAGEAIKAWEAERWIALEALSKETMGKSWRECMDYMHKVLPTGVAFDRPKYRTVSVKTEALRELLEMGKDERRAEMKRRREAGGLEAESALSERDVEALGKALAAMEEEGRVLSRVEARYLVEVQHEENLKLSRGEALYAVLMYEQPTYTERMETQGYTPEVIEGFRKFIGEGMLEFGYGLRELFAKQGDRVAAVYERTFGVPFPREENYFAARWNVTGMKDNPAEQLLAGMAGTPGAGNGWMKQRVDHNLELDMTKDALQVFLQATSLTDTWMATQDIVADFKAWTRDTEFDKALTVLLGKEGYDNLKDWIRILEMGGVQDCLNMGVSQDVINGLYGSGAVAILGLRIQTLLKQTPSIFNGLLGAHDISAAEWFATMSRMKNGDAPMTYKRMVNSTLMKMRQQGKAGNMAGQAMRSGDTASSAAEGLLMASMLPMEWVDARCMAIGLVPVWNVYYQRAVDQGASAQEAEQSAWEQTALVANLASQPIGWLNKSKIAQSRNPIVKSAFYMLSENTAKFALCRALWRGGKKKAAIRAWLVYGAANAAISAMLDALQGDPEEFEKGKWWEYVLSALYGPASGIPGVGEALEAAVNTLLNLTGEVADIDWMKKVKTRASAGRALVDIQGSWKAMKRIYGFMTDNKEHSLAEYTRAAGTVSRTLAIGTGWMGNMVGYWSTAVAVLMNPIDFGARVWRNMKHYWD